MADYLLVDGYNIIFAWPELKQLAETNLDSARLKLQDILSKIPYSLPDGADESAHQKCPDTAGKCMGFGHRLLDILVVTSYLLLLFNVHSAHPFV